MSLLIRYLNTYRNFSKATWINILAVFIMSFGLMMSSIFTLFLNSKGINITIIAWIIAIGGGGGIIGSYLAGYLAKYLDLTRIAQFSLFMFGVTTLLFTFIKNVNLFFIIYFLSNLFNGLFRPANNLMLFARTEETEHPRVMALYRVAFNLGLAFATSIGSFLATIHFYWFFIFSASMAILGSIILFSFHSLLTVKYVTTIKKNQENKAKNSWELFFKQYSFLILCLLFFGSSLIFNQTRITYSLFLTEDYHLNLQQIGWLFMINFLLIVFIEVPLMTRLKKANQISLTMWGSIFIGLGMVILPFGNSLEFAACSVLLWSIGEILTASPFFVLAYRFAPEDGKSFYVAVFHSIFSTGLVLAPLVGGFLYPLYHGYLLWISCGFITTFMMLGFWYLKHKEK